MIPSKMAGLVEGSHFVVLLVFVIASIHTASADDKLQLELMARISALEQQGAYEKSGDGIFFIGREQTATLQLQATTMKAMETKLERQNARIESQDARLKDQAKEILGYKHRMEQLETTVQNLQKRERTGHPAHAHLDSESGSDVKPRQSSLTGFQTGRSRRLAVAGESPIAFHAVLKKKTEVGHIGVNQKIVFPDVNLNLGGGYQNQHGIFTAPVPGVYLFSTSILSHNSATHNYIYVHLMKNGQVLANAYSRGSSGLHDQGSVTVVTQMGAGDQVWVSLYQPADASIWGDSFDSFTGCLIVGL